MATSVLEKSLFANDKTPNFNELDQSVIGQAAWSLFLEAKAEFSEQNFKASLDASEKLLSIVWEKLNTGHWKDVDITWRFFYSYISALKALCTLRFASGNDYQLKALNSCDMGLLMGAPVMDNVLCTAAQKIQDQLNLQTQEEEKDLSSCSPQSVAAPALLNPIPRLELPSLEYFRREHMLLERTVVVCGAMEHWPAFRGKRAWCPHYLRRCAGHRLVPVELGARYTDSSWTQRIMPLNQFISDHVCTPKSQLTGYLAQHQLLDQIPKLREDISVPEYCCVGRDPEQVDINAWFGPQGTVSPLHTDPKHNMLAQVRGSKYIQLYAPSDTQHLSPHDGFLLDNTSQIDVENPNLERFPSFAKARVSDCVLRPGEMLYIPAKHWHYVRSLEESFSVSFWWE